MKSALTVGALVGWLVLSVIAYRIINRPTNHVLRYNTQLEPEISEPDISIGHALSKPFAGAHEAIG